MPQSDQGHRNLRYSTIDGVCSTPWTLLSLPGSFLMAGLLNKFFDVGPFWFGIIASMPALANASNILLIPVISKVMTVREMTLNFSSINAGLWLCALITIAFLPIDQPAHVGLFFAVFYSFAALSQSVLAVGWTTWIGDIVPESIRGRYISRRNRLCNISTLSFMALSLFVLDEANVSRSAYLILAGIAILGRLIAIFIQHLIRSETPSGDSITSAHWVEDFALLRKESGYVRFVIFGSICGFFLAFLGVLGPLFIFNILEASAAKFTALSIAATITGTLSLRIWGELIDRHGALPVLMIAFISWRCGDFFWVLITPATTNGLFLIWIWGGAMATGYLLASFNLLLKLIPRRSRTAGISLNLTITSVAAVVAPILAGSLIGWATSQHYDLDLTYRISLFCATAGSLASVACLIGIKEPTVDPTLNTIYGAMRTLRQQTVTQGLAFLSNATFILRRKD